MKKILLDTNIIIDREKHAVVERNISSFIAAMFDSDKYRIVVHPMSYDDLNNNRDKQEREIALSKIAAHPKVKNPPVATEEFHDAVGLGPSQNDYIDNNLLYAVETNCVAYLITNDKGIHRKAKRVGLGNRVLNIKKAAQLFTPEEEKNVYTPVAIKSIPLYGINLRQAFFNSLRADYRDFDDWYGRKALEGKKAYCSFVDDNEDTLGAFLFLQVEGLGEKYEGFDEKLPPKPRLKISTMKVSDNGKHIGESFIDIIFEEARQAKVSEIYTTVYPKQEMLIDLLKEYGFQKVTERKTPDGKGKMQKEDVLLKQINNVEYPNIDWNKDVFIVPIQPKYHRMLFPKAERSYQIEMSDLFIEKPCSNAIKKAYVTRSNSKLIKPEDVLCFYASHKKMSVTVIGTVEKVFTDFESGEEVYKLARKRTVYDREELINDYSTATKVIMFKKHLVLENPIPYRELLSEGVVNGPIQTITKVDSDIIRRLIEKKNGELKCAE